MTLRRWLPAALVSLVVWGQQVVYVVSLGDSLSPVADPFSEANALRAGEGYVQEGFTRNFGLPMVGYGDQFPEVGFGLQGTAVYTHYPPGPDLLAGALTKLFGRHRVGLYRSAPLIVGLLSLGALAWMLTRAFGALPAAGLLAGCALAPMFSNMMHGLHYQGYAFSLFLVELGTLIRLFGPHAVDRPAFPLAALWALGFLQGWLSFDYCFLVTFAPLPLAILWEKSDRREAIRRAGLSIFLLGFGFSVAHGLHFAQVAAFHGGVQPALADLAGRAQVRAGTPTLADRLLLVWQYATVHAPGPQYFSWALPLALIWVMALLILNRGALTLFEPLRWNVAWHVRRGRSVWALAVAWGISLLWVAVMWEHALDHLHFVPRHYFLFYFLCLLVPFAGAVEASSHPAAPEEIINAGRATSGGCLDGRP
jgi:hypothetical protein